MRGNEDGNESNENHFPSVHLRTIWIVKQTTFLYFPPYVETVELDYQRKRSLLTSAKHESGQESFLVVVGVPIISKMGKKNCTEPFFAIYDSLFSSAHKTEINTMTNFFPLYAFANNPKFGEGLRSHKR